jgi:hypothetical protein
MKVVVEAAGVEQGYRIENRQVAEFYVASEVIESGKRARFTERLYL